MHFSRARLRGHRNGLGLPESAVAERVGLTHEQYERIEAGVDVPAEPLVALLAKTLGVPNFELYAMDSSWEEDYCDAVLQHLGPMSSEEVAIVARAIAPSLTRKVAS